MDDDERMKTLTVQAPQSDLDPNPVDIILRLLWLVGTAERQMTLIALRKDLFLENLTREVYETKFSTFFEIQKCTKSHRHWNLHGNFLKDKASYEAKLLQSLRICDVDGFCDTIFIDRDLVKQPEKLFEYFDKISQDRVFCDIPELRYTPLTSALAKPSDSKKRESWFDLHSGNTIGSIFLGFLDYNVTVKYSSV